jgi:hypothetical protein
MLPILPPVFVQALGHRELLVRFPISNFFANLPLDKFQSEYKIRKTI